MKKSILLFAILLCINIISANLVISPNPADIDAKIGIDNSFQLTLKNNYAFEIKSFSFSNLTGFSFPNIILSPGQQKIVNLTIHPTEMKTETILSEVSFKYNVDIPSTPQTHQVNITSNGFSPLFLTIHEEDTVVWKNNDDISHSVTGSFFNENVLPGETVEITFNDIGTINYQDLVLYWGATIQVLDKSIPQEVNNPLYNQVWHVNLDVISDPTNLSINLINRNFEVDATGLVEGLISIENMGTEIARSVQLTSNSDWILFGENNFDLEVGSQNINYVTFQIQPFIMNENQTDKTYNYTINIKASNTQNYLENISVYVPFSDVFQDFSSEEGFFVWFSEVYCPQYPKSFLCNTSIATNEPQIIIRDPEIPINLSAVALYSALQRIQRIEDSNQRTNNKLNSLTDMLDGVLPEIKDLLNQTLQRAEKAEDNSETTQRVFWIIIIFAILIGGFVVVWNSVRKLKYKKSLMVIRR